MSEAFAADMDAIDVDRPDLAVIERRGRIDAAEIWAMRRTMFENGAIDWSEAEAIFRVDRACDCTDPRWQELYVDALTDFLVWNATPQGIIDEDRAKLLLDNIVIEGRVAGAHALELLVNVIHWSISCPEALVETAMEAVRDSVVGSDVAAYGQGRTPGVIDGVDVSLIRRVIYAGATDSGYTVTRREAELLFDLNRAARGSDNDPAWQRLFVHGVANYLMFPRGATEVPDAIEFAEREAWMAERRGTGALLRKVGRRIACLDPGRSWSEADILGSRRAARYAALQERRTREALARGGVGEAEARWLVARIGRDGRTMDDNQRALLRFIRDNSVRTHRLLAQCFRLARFG